MGSLRHLRDEDEDEEVVALPSLSEALLVTTILIIGLPVEVHIQDGSIYSGIFHTASLHNGYGIALKKAKMIKKGTRNANTSVGVINTLVVLPEDLVQVVAKGVMLPADNASTATFCDDEEAVLGTPDSPQGSENAALGGEHLNQERHVKSNRSQDVEDGCFHHSVSMKEVPEVHGSNTSCNGCYTERNVHKENHAMVAYNMLANGSTSTSDSSPSVRLHNQFHDDQLPKEFNCTASVASGIRGAAQPKADASRGSLVVPTNTTPVQNPLAKRTVKESRLNPGAKVFSPSLPDFRTTAPLVPTVPSVAYVPYSIPTLRIAPAQPEVGIRPIAQCSSWPIKFVPYVSQTSINADNSLHYIPSITGHVATRAQPLRQVTQYQPFQAIPPYVNTNSQNAMFGRPNQVVYVRPVTHDVIQGPAALSQAVYPLLTSHHLHVSKHEGVFGGQQLQVSVTPPLGTNVPPQFAMSSHIQLPQPVFSSIRPAPV